MSDGGIRMDFLELRVQTLEKYLAALAKWTNFNPQQNITEIYGTGRGVFANEVNPDETANPQVNSSDEILPPQPNPEGVEVTSDCSDNNQQGNGEGVDIPPAQNPNPEGGSSMELQDQLNEDGRTATAAGGSVDGRVNPGSKCNGEIPPQMKTETDQKFYIKDESDREEDSSAIAAGSSDTRKRKRSPKKKSTTAVKSSTSGLKSLNLTSNSRILPKKKKMGDSSHPLKCPHCPKTFPLKSQLVRHTKIHSGEKPFRCPHCDFSTAWEPNLDRHICRKHPNAKQLLRVRKGMSSWTILKKHGYLHCYFCTYKTKSSNSLVAHVRKHTGEEPFNCPLCSYSAKENGTLMSHLDNHH